MAGAGDAIPADKGGRSRKGANDVSGAFGDEQRAPKRPRLSNGNAHMPAPVPAAAGAAPVARPGAQWDEDDGE